MSLKLRVAAFCVAAAACPAVASAQGIHVMTAIYGTPATGRTCDASGAVASACDHQKQCVLDIRNVKLCGDPDFLVVKQVGITYRCGRVVYKTAASEYYLSTLACR